MSKVDTLFDRVGDYEAVPSDEDLNVSSNWPVQNINFSRTPPAKTKQRPKISVPQTLPPLLFDGFLDSPRSWRSFDEQVYNPVSNGYASQVFNPVSVGYPSPGFSEAEAFGSDIQAALRSLSSDACGKSSVGSEPEQSSSSEVSQEARGGAMDLACPASDDRESEGFRLSCSETTGDGEWEGVVKLVQELNSWFNDSSCPGNAKMEGIDQKPDKMGAQPNPEGGASAQEMKNLEVVRKGPCCGDDILSILSTIQRNVEKIREAVPKIAGQRHKFTVLVHRQCAAAVGAVKLISQLAEAAVAIIPEILRQVDSAVSDSWVSTDVKDPCRESSDKCKGSSTVSPNPQAFSAPKEEGAIGDPAGMDSLAPTLAAVSISPPNTMLVNTVLEKANGPAEDIKLVSELGPVAENENASSLVADLLAPCDRMTGAGGFLPPPTTSGSPFRFGQWDNDLKEVLPLGNSAEKLPSGTAGALNELLSPSDSCTLAPQDESDEGDTKGSTQFPLGSFTLMEIDDLEILTEQTHYCNICSKGFKRDANLRMHMRSHGGKYKSSTALVRSERPPKVVQEMVGGKPTRYSCPYAGCNRNMKHPKFQALKTMLCLKNHYRRSHCAKTLRCSICKSKQFSVVADLKTHEKHCGSDKWACSCGTTFSRKEKLYGHVSLFVGHVPVDASTVASNAASAISGDPLQVQLSGPLASNRDGSSGSTENVWQDW